MAALFLGLFLIGIGFLVKAFPNLIAGYNTMSQKQKANVDIEGLSSFMRNGFLVIGLLVIIGFYVLKLAGLHALLDYFMPVVILGGVLFLVFRARKFDRNEEKMVKSRLKNVIGIGVLVFVAAMIGRAYIPSQFEIEDDRVIFSGMYGTEIYITEIESVSLINKRPSIKARTNGFSLGSVKKGFFSIENYGRCRLLMDASQGPFLEINTRDQGTIFVNFKNKTETESVYNSLNEIKKQSEKG